MPCAVTAITIVCGLFAPSIPLPDRVLTATSPLEFTPSFIEETKLILAGYATTPDGAIAVEFLGDFSAAIVVPIPIKRPIRMAELEVDDPPKAKSKKRSKRKKINLFSWKGGGKKPANFHRVNMSKPGFRAVKAAARKYGVDVNFALGVAAQESRGKCGARSHANAKGVMQVIPGTARKHGVRRSKRLYNCKVGAETGVKELKHCLKVARGNRPKALACYNAGGGWLTSRKYRGRRLPRETRKYIKIITGKRVERVT